MRSARVLAMILTITFIAGWASVDHWLKEMTGWPEAYGFHCHAPRGCLFQDLIYSPRLLERAGFYEVLQFAHLWVLWVLVLIVGIWLLASRRLKRHRDRIRPME